MLTEHKNKTIVRYHSFPHKRSSGREKNCLAQTRINRKTHFHMDAFHLKFHPTMVLKLKGWITYMHFLVKSD